MSLGNGLGGYGPDRSTTSFVVKWILWGVVIVVILVALGWFLSWLFVPAQVASPQNVREQWQFAYGYEEKLQAAAQQICIAEEAVASAVGSTEKEQRRSQLIAYEINYTRLQADYDARLRNAFEAKLVAPPDVPKVAPTLTQQKERGVCR